MKNVGQILKRHIEDNHLKKGEIAKSVGISYNYLSTLFKQDTMDAKLVENLFVAFGLHPAIVFDVPEQMTKKFCDIYAQTVLGNATVQITEAENLRELLEEKERIIAEKERTIQILMASTGFAVPGQNRDNDDK